MTPAKEVKGAGSRGGKVCGLSAGAPPLLQMCGAFPFPLYSLWLRSLTTSGSSSCALGPLHESRRTVWT